MTRYGRKSYVLINRGWLKITGERWEQTNFCEERRAVVETRLVAGGHQSQMTQFRPLHIGGRQALEMLANNKTSSKSQWLIPA